MFRRLYSFAVGEDGKPRKLETLKSLLMGSKENSQNVFINSSLAINNFLIFVPHFKKIVSALNTLSWQANRSDEIAH